ncbi:MAG: hypothetical protein PHX20_06300 [Candidatus Omnitrophica bacterium]|nr:hypothetical protein [Candidatus Omnitrophota bacterium]MDD5437138.1 hypothetical protein [Candidatus Omnitrophota bacterium]
MREVLFKNLTSLSSRKKDIFLKEVFEKDGMVARTERRCFYYIKDIKHLGSDEELQRWISQQGDAGNINKRQFHIMKEHNDAHSEDKIICKILGTFYAVINRSVYTIGFMHSFKVRFEKASLAN